MLGSSRQRRMVSLGKVTAPKPVNLPSQKKENNGNDPSVNLVPKAATTWADSTPPHAPTHATPPSQQEEVPKLPPRVIPAQPSPAWGGAGLPEERRRALELASREQFPSLGAPQQAGGPLPDTDRRPRSPRAAWDDDERGPYAGPPIPYAGDSTLQYYPDRGDRGYGYPPRGYEDRAAGPYDRYDRPERPPYDRYDRGGSYDRYDRSGSYDRYDRGGFGHDRDERPPFPARGSGYRDDHPPPPPHDREHSLYQPPRRLPGYDRDGAHHEYGEYERDRRGSAPGPFPPSHGAPMDRGEHAPVGGRPTGWSTEEVDLDQPRAQEREWVGFRDAHRPRGMPAGYADRDAVSSEDGPHRDGWARAPSRAQPVAAGGEYPPYPIVPPPPPPPPPPKDSGAALLPSRASAELTDARTASTELSSLSDAVSRRATVGSGSTAPLTGRVSDQPEAALSSSHPGARYSVDDAGKEHTPPTGVLDATAAVIPPPPPPEPPSSAKASNVGLGPPRPVSAPPPTMAPSPRAAQQQQHTPTRILKREPRGPGPLGLGPVGPPPPPPPAAARAPWGPVPAAQRLAALTMEGQSGTVRHPPVASAGSLSLPTEASFMEHITTSATSAESHQQVGVAVARSHLPPSLQGLSLQPVLPLGAFQQEGSSHASSGLFGSTSMAATSGSEPLMSFGVAASGPVMAGSQGTNRPHVLEGAGPISLGLSQASAALAPAGLPPLQFGDILLPSAIDGSVDPDGTPPPASQHRHLLGGDLTAQLGSSGVFTGEKNLRGRGGRRGGHEGRRGGRGNEGRGRGHGGRGRGHNAAAAGVISSGVEGPSTITGVVVSPPPPPPPMAPPPPPPLQGQGEPVGGDNTKNGKPLKPRGNRGQTKIPSKGPGTTPATGEGSKAAVLKRRGPKPGEKERPPGLHTSEGDAGDDGETGANGKPSVNGRKTRGTRGKRRGRGGIGDAGEEGEVPGSPHAGATAGCVSKPRPPPPRRSNKAPGGGDEASFAGAQ